MVPLLVISASAPSSGPSFRYSSRKSLRDRCTRSHAPAHGYWHRNSIRRTRCNGRRHWPRHWRSPRCCRTRCWSGMTCQDLPHSFQAAGRRRRWLPHWPGWRCHRSPVRIGIGVRRDGAAVLHDGVDGRIGGAAHRLIDAGGEGLGGDAPRECFELPLVVEDGGGGGLGRDRRPYRFARESINQVPANHVLIDADGPCCCRGILEGTGMAIAFAEIPPWFATSAMLLTLPSTSCDTPSAWATAEVCT